MKIYLQKSEKIDKNLMRYAIKFFANKLMSEKLCKTLEIKVKFVTMKKERGFKVSYAQVSYEEREQGTPRKFIIDINKDISKRMIISCLAHEIAHIKQYAKGELKDLNSGMSKFNQDYFEEDLDYHDQPWEIDAFGRELCMTAQLKRVLKKKKGQISKFDLKDFECLKSKKN